IRPGGKSCTLLVILRGGQALEVYVNGTAVTRPIRLEHPLVPRVAHDIVTWDREAEFTRFTLWPLSPPVPGAGEGGRPPDLSKAEEYIDADFSDPNKRYFAENRDKVMEAFFEKGCFVL